MKRFLFLLVSLCTFAACKVDSTEVHMSGISADIRVVAEQSDQTDVTVYLQRGDIDSLTYLDLKGNDKLFATAAGMTEKELSRSAFITISYDTRYSGITAAATEFAVRFQRTIDRGAPRSACTMPAAFDFSTPNAATQFSRATQDIDVTYSPSGSGDQMRFKLTGSCINTVERTIDTGDLGSFKIQKSLITAQTDEQNKTCDVTLELERVKKGTLDSNFGKGGKIECLQRRTRAFKSAP
ncbi:MAG: hypothetical protein IT381_20960 [Deltaproteobacteria bacterium]|nr:hypothetical protein [Deltaproteobacteria bacterium]